MHSKLKVSKKCKHFLDTFLVQISSESYNGYMFSVAFKALST